MMRTGPQESGGAGISMEALAGLNDEIAAWVRAGVPLERGLLRDDGRFVGGLGRIQRTLAERLGRGESLVEALEAERGRIPPLYRAVVAAGAESGRLAVALEGLSRFIKGYSETRRTVGLALWYPLLILTLAYGLFLVLVTTVVPRFLSAFDSLGLEVAAPLSWLETVGELAPYWWPIGPVVLLMVGVVWWRSGDAATFEGSRWGVVKLFPTVRSILADSEAAGVAELLALLLENGVPYPRALVLAAEAGGDHRMAEAARRIAAALERGDPAGRAFHERDGRAFPPLLRWTLASALPGGQLPGALYTLASSYRRRADFRAERLRILLPTILLVLLGATATLIYGLTLFVPLSRMLADLAGP